MERIQAAIQKAKEQRAAAGPAAGAPAMQAPGAAAVAPPQPGGAWARLQAFSPDPDRMAREHIVCFDRADPVHMTFDILRTKILRQMEENGWTSLAITSPTSGCGKSMISLNLAFSLAQKKERPAVLMDIDLRRPTLARTLGLEGAGHSMESFLQGQSGLEENFVRYDESLAIGTNAKAIRNPSELLTHPLTGQVLGRMREELRPETLIYDLPPMLACDDVMAFMPNFDCVLLVAGAELTTFSEIDKCERDLSAETNVVGVVLNKCRYMPDQYDYYG